MFVHRFVFAVLSTLCMLSLHADITIRPAQPADLPACILIAQEAMLNVPRPFVSAEKEAEIAEKIKNLDEKLFEPFLPIRLGTLLVAENEQKQIVGCMKVFPFCVMNDATWYEFLSLEKDGTPEKSMTWYRDHCDGSAVYVSNLYISAACKGKGNGKNFLKFIATKFPQAQKIYLDTDARNTPAIGFYQHLGFSVLQQPHDVAQEDTLFFTIDVSRL